MKVSNLWQSDPANNHHVIINFDAGCLLLPFHAENDAEARFTAHHPLVSLGGSFQRKHFVHRMHTARRAEAQRILRVNRCAGIPALDRSLTADEQNWIDGKRTGRTDHHEHTIWRKPAERRRHRVSVGYRSDNHFGTAKLVKFRSRIFLPTIDVMNRAQFFGEGFLVLSARDRHCFKAHLHGELYAKMTKSTDPEYSNNIARSRTAVPKRIERSHAGAHERGTIDRR